VTRQLNTHDFYSDLEEIGRNSMVPTLLETATLATGMGFAAVARVTESRWITCQTVDKISFGLEPGDELDVESTLCHEVRLSNTEIVIDDVANDPIYCNHHTPATYGIQSYISVPIHRRDGTFFGTLCAIDPNPRTLKTPNILAMFRLFASLLGDSLEIEDKLKESQIAIDQERHLTEVQQQFIAILAHDLRNPISALESGLRIMARKDLDEPTTKLVTLMKASLGRMSNLIENLLDRARQRHDGGVIIERDAAEPLEPVIQQIVAEIKSVSPDHDIECDIDLDGNVDCDRERIAQMLSNLLRNAITHGAEGQRIDLVAKRVDSEIILSVANQGKMIPPSILPSLFVPFQQGGANKKRKGLGLGLYIASEIAKAHGGTLNVVSDERETKFTFRMPQGTVPQ
tara:strand:+ start:512 stop:1714 length:1203 start_codon:yes stop_codon:yes gene_type:complete